jgi:hypothetical protein
LPQRDAQTIGQKRHEQVRFDPLGFLRMGVQLFANESKRKPSVPRGGSENWPRAAGTAGV